MDQPARLFLCARCRVQVILCSRCDRGNRYCGRACWRLARTEARHQAAQRYQRSWRGRVCHAQRSARWRRRRAERDVQRDTAGHHAQAGEHNVTHQGSQPQGASAPLLAWTHDRTCAQLVAPATPATPAEEGSDVTDGTDSTVAPGAAQGTAIVGTFWICRRCSARQGTAVRLGFLRRGLPGKRRHDHSP